MNEQFARGIRVRRLYHHGERRLFVVPLDHAVTDGPVSFSGHLDRLLEQLAGNGVDAVVLHKGSLRHVRPGWFRRMSLVVHLSAGTSRAPDPDAKVLVTGVAEAVRLGADAVSVHVNLGSAGEHRQLAYLGAVAGACDRWGVPLLAMVYPRGPAIGRPTGPASAASGRSAAESAVTRPEGLGELVAHATVLAAELGADLVKTVYPGSPVAMSSVTERCPIPVLVAGGPSGPGADPLAGLRGALVGGAGGVAVGRRVFEAPDPGAAARSIAELVHQSEMNGAPV